MFSSKTTIISARLLSETSCSIRMGLSHILVNSFLHETATSINTVTVNLIYSEAGTNIDLKKTKKKTCYKNIMHLD